MVGAAPWGIASAAIQQVLPTPMRGRASALYLAVVGLIGMGIGPTAVAACTQYFFRRDDAVNYSLLVVSVMALLAAALLLWKGSKAFLGSLDRLRVWSAANSEEGLKTADGLSGATVSRPALRRCLKKLNRGDKLTVRKLDRLDGSLRDLITMLDDLKPRRVKFHSLTEAIDTDVSQKEQGTGFLNGGVLWSSDCRG
jgi:MFS family permease